MTAEHESTGFRHLLSAFGGFLQRQNLGVIAHFWELAMAW